MNIPLTIVITILFVLVSFAIYFVNKKKKRYLIAPLVLTNVGLVFLFLTQLTRSTGSWDDLIYVLFGFVSFILAILTAAIILIVRFIRNKQENSKG